MAKFRVIVRQEYVWDTTVEADDATEAERIVHEDVLDYFQTNPDDAEGLTFVCAQDGSVQVEED